MQLAHLRPEERLGLAAAAALHVALLSGAGVQCLARASACSPAGAHGGEPGGRSLAKGYRARSRSRRRRPRLLPRCPKSRPLRPRLSRRSGWSRPSLCRRRSSAPPCSPSRNPRPSRSPLPRAAAAEAGSAIISSKVKAAAPAATRKAARRQHSALPSRPRSSARFPASCGRTGLRRKGSMLKSWSPSCAFDLNDDGSLAGEPRVVSQTGRTDANAAQMGRHAELAIRAVKLAAPFDLPEEYYQYWKSVGFEVRQEFVPMKKILAILLLALAAPLAAQQAACRACPGDAASARGSCRGR